MPDCSRRRSWRSATRSLPHRVAAFRAAQTEEVAEAVEDEHEAPLPPGSTIGILGGGQLGRMLAVAAARSASNRTSIATDANSPAFDVAAAHTIWRQ